MYTHEFLEDSARAHGWDGGEETLPLYLPFGILRVLGAEHPYHTQVTKVAKKMRIERSVLNWMFTFENDRAFNDVLMERIYVNPPDGGEGEGQQPPSLMVKSNQYGEGKEGEEGDEGEDDQEGEQQGQQKQQGQGNGQYKQDEGEQQGQKPQPSPSVPSKAKPRQRAGQTPNQQQKSLNEWLKSMRQQQQREQKQQQGEMVSNHNYGKSHDNSIGDFRIANRMRSYYEQIVGAFDQLLTPRYDASKVVKRMISHLSLDPARKWEDGRPDMVIMTDISGSCQDVSAAITLAANSACMLGTPQGRIISLPFMNNYLEHGSYGYINGKALVSIGGGERGRAGGELQQELARQINRTPDKRQAPLLTDMIVKYGGVSTKDAEMLFEGMHNSYKWDFILSALLAHELGGRLTAHMPSYNPYSVGFHELTYDSQLSHDDKVKRFGSTPAAQSALQTIQDKGALRPLLIGKSEEDFKKIHMATDKVVFDAQQDLRYVMGMTKKKGNWEVESKGGKQFTTTLAAGTGRLQSRELTDIAMLASLDCGYYIYYTDHDGIPAILALAALLKPHQHLYVLTYGNIPNMQVPNYKQWQHGELGSSARGQVISFLQETDGWANRARNRVGFHTALGRYGHPAIAAKRIGVGIPSYAYTPKYYGDAQWLPTWFNGYGWYELMGAKGMTQTTVIPNVDGVEGALDAMRLIASPDRMALAVEGGRKVRAEMEKQGYWSNSRKMPLHGLGTLAQTPFAVL